MEKYFNIEFEKPWGKEDWQRVWKHLMGSRIAIRHNGKTIVGEVWSYGWHPDKGIDHIGCRCVDEELPEIPRMKIDFHPDALANSSVSFCDL